ncbi:MAG: 4-hydroxy-tetrahydrodipicolinate synthase [Gemmataceae bacterium]
MTIKLQGIIPPSVTPFHADESLDLPRLKTHIDFLIGKGVHGIFVLGTTGEFYALDETEKQTVIATAVEHVAGRVPVFAGTGAETTREVVRLTKMAERLGIAGVSVITPYFLKPTQDEMIDHFRRVAESTSVGVILYNNPSTCAGTNIDPPTVAKLAQIPNIIGIKDSSGDMQNTLETIRLSPPEFSVLIGRDTLILPGLAFGVKGSIPASSNIAPALCVGIYEQFVRGDMAAAKSYQERLTPVRKALSFGTGNGVVKEAMALLGRPAGPNRRPVSPLSAEKRDMLAKILADAGVTE